MSPHRRTVVGVTPTSDPGKSTIFRAICNLADLLTSLARKEKPARRDADKKTWFADQGSSDPSRYWVWK
jgi:hypothetical protein